MIFKIKLITVLEKPLRGMLNTCEKDKIVYSHSLGETVFN